MKKVALSLAGMLAAAAFAPEASAIPAFARQTGMACNACHFQHYPLLNGFGRSFKASAFTLMGAEGKVEGDGLSLPNTLNMAVLGTAGYVKTNGAKGNQVKTPGNGTVFVPGTNGEMSLFIGGRISDNAGSIGELTFLGLGGAGTLAQTKTPIFFEVGGGYRTGVVLFTTAGAGPAYSYETLNTGAVATHTMMFVVGDATGAIMNTLSAQQYIGTGTAATGAALVANGDMGFINIAKFHMAGPTDLAFSGAALGSTYARVAGTVDAGGWDLGVGGQFWGGSSLNLAAGPALVQGVFDTKATAVDFQLQGNVAELPLGFYASWASAPASTAPRNNMYNFGGAKNRTAIVISAELGIVPEKVMLGAAYRRGKTGAATADGDNSMLVEASYKLAQNQTLALDYVHQSGSSWNGVLGNNQYNLSLSTLW